MKCLQSIFAGSLILVSASAHAATYYAAPAGDDDNLGTQAAPFKTLAKGASVLAPGDTLLVRAGTYAEEFYNGIPGGTSWSAPVTIAAYPGEKPVIQAPPGASRVLTFASASVAYVVIDGLVLDATNSQYDAVKITWGSADGASHHIRLKSCEIFGSPGQGILVTGENGTDVTGNEFIDLDVHDNGTTDFDHGFYVSTAGNLIDGCRVHRNAGWGIHVYNGNAPDADNNVIRNNRSYDNARVGNRGVGIGIYSGSGTIAYNNLIWGNKLGISVNYAADGSGVFNNVVAHNIEGGIDIGQEASGAIVKNNAIWQNGAGLVDNGAATQSDANVVDVDPLFVDENNHDFHVNSGSPLIDKGVTLAEVKVDFDGVARPQGSTYDVGAYEYCETGCAQAGAGGAAGSAGAGGASSGGASSGGAGGATGTGASSSGGATTGGGSGGKSSSGGAKANGASDDGGCGCRVTPERGQPLAALALIVLVSSARRRRVR